MKTRRRRGLSAGTIFMLVLTATVLAGFCMLLPTLTGNKDILLDASKLAVAIDSSFSKLAAATDRHTHSVPEQNQAISLPASLLATATPLTQPVSTPIPTLPPKQSFSLCASGNVLFNSRVQRELDAGENASYHLLTDHIVGKLQADLSIVTIGNTYISSQKLSDLNMPENMLSALAASGINVLSLCDADMLNSGLTGLTETKQAIRERGIIPVGLNLSKEERNQPPVLSLNGINVAILSYMEGLNSNAKKKLTDEELAFAYAELNMDTVLSDISLARSSGTDIILVNLSWGKTGASKPTEEQRSMAQQMADAGADIILGTGSGVLQPVQILSANRGDGNYHPVLCAYSLGNLFDFDRDKRSTLCSILLKTEVVYDRSTGSVAFDDLTYTPTYAWRGKEGKYTRQRILIADPENAPEFVDKDQKSVMQRCLDLVNEVMSDTGIPPIAQ